MAEGACAAAFAADAVAAAAAAARVIIHCFQALHQQIVIAINVAVTQLQIAVCLHQGGGDSI